jgi:hypothetical protein
MGKPARGHARAAPPESIGRGRATGGTETSQYPEERKSNETPRVAASERGPAQTRARVRALGRCCTRGCGSAHPGSQTAPGAVTKRGPSGTGMEGPAAEGNSPVREGAPPARARNPSRAGHVEPGPNPGGPPSKAEHYPVTDSALVP